MNGNNSLITFKDETFQSLAGHCHKNQLEKMCEQLEAEMATYSQQVANYLQLLKVIRDGKDSA